MKINANDYDFRLFIIKYDLNVRYPGEMSAKKHSRCEMPGWKVGGEEFRMSNTRMECRRIRIPDMRHPDKVEILNSTCIWRQFPLTSGCMILCGFFYLF